MFDFKFQIPTLEEVLLMLIEFNEQHKGSRNPDGNLVGVLIELKDAEVLIFHSVNVKFSSIDNIKIYKSLKFFTNC